MVTASSHMIAAATAVRLRSATVTTWITTPPMLQPWPSTSTCATPSISTGGGEVARYVAKYGQPQGRVAKAILVSAVQPLMVKTADNPDGTPIEVFDGFRDALAANRAEFFLDVASGPFYGFNREGAKSLKA